MLASGRREEVLTPPNLAQAYGMNFRRLDIEGSQNADFDHLISLVS